jgi:alpha-D-ribose 1-methylphosphonate 5-triphosphate diphosphatase
MERLILTNGRVVTPTGNFIGSVVVEDGIITEIASDRYYHEGLDLNEQWLIPGIIDIHTDYLEKEMYPRPSASFPLPFAFHYLDARAAACGITSVFCALSFSDDPSKDRTFDQAFQLTREFEKIKSNLLIRHFLHARLDPNTDRIMDYLEEIKKLESLCLVVYNENIPGQRQFRLEGLIEKFAVTKGKSMEEAAKEVHDKIEKLSKINNRPAIYGALKDQFILGSHDDTTEGHIIEAKKFGAVLAEMPTTIEAARKAKELDMWVCMGAPNYYRGGSHCDNLSCIDAMNENLVDILCSDYHFPTLLGSVVKMINQNFNPSEAVNYVTLNPAKMLKFDHLGSIQVGKKADLVSFAIVNSYAAVSNVFIEGALKYNSNYCLNTVHKKRFEPEYN